ncbi:TetR family transcriptional regulator [Parvibaculaceae bacterium PLY_AMNH_Bact1]|nr:TetR family transcriptional regulator [Parvibaculaceae bacterium PLY_AMNH_Bact1]
MSGIATKTIEASIKARPARRRGRPLRNSPDRRADIIRASTVLFLKDGYTNTTLRRIARAADVNVALVHYYFTSKQGLYQEVLNAALKTTFTALKEPQKAPLSVDEIARTLTAPPYKHPGLVHRLSAVNTPPEAREATAAVMRRLSLRLTACIRSLQRLGSVRRDLDAELFTQTCLDLCWSPFRRDQIQSEENKEKAQTPFTKVLLARHVEQNILILTSAATSTPGGSNCTEKRGTQMAPLSATSPKA